MIKERMLKLLIMSKINEQLCADKIYNDWFKANHDIDKFYKDYYELGKEFLTPYMKNTDSKE